MPNKEDDIVNTDIYHDKRGKHVIVSKTPTKTAPKLPQWYHDTVRDAMRDMIPESSLYAHIYVVRERHRQTDREVHHSLTKSIW